MIKSVLKLIAEYFVFLGGFLFVFAVGAIYAFLRPEGAVVGSIFLIIGIGWILFLIKYFWDLLEKHSNSKDNSHLP